MLDVIDDHVERPLTCGQPINPTIHCSLPILVYKSTHIYVASMLLQIKGMELWTIFLWKQRKQGMDILGNYDVQGFVDFDSGESRYAFSNILLTNVYFNSKVLFVKDFIYRMTQKNQQKTSIDKMTQKNKQNFGPSNYCC